MTPEDKLPPELEDQYDPDEVFEIDGTPEDLADALFKKQEGEQDSR
ncbi:MAG: hypothetical protein OXH23_17795 [bacterium]|nr:hypothetical protein [bacterium]